MRNLIAVIFLSVILVGCATAGDHRREVQDDTGDRLTVGTVQKEIRVGMSGAEVAEVLGEGDAGRAAVPHVLPLRDGPEVPELPQ